MKCLRKLILKESHFLPDELSEVFFQNVWCIPEALEQNLEFIDKWCPKIPEAPTIIDGEYREISEDKNSEE